MGIGYSRFIVGVAILSAGASVAVRADLYRGVSPGGNFDLSHWSLRLPVDDNGGTTGQGRIVRPSELQGANGYTSRYFQTDKDGSVVLYAPIFGARSATSPNARSELREMLNPNSGSTNWTDATTSVLRVQARILRVPSDGKMIIGQVHGYGNGQTLLGLQYEYKQSAGTGSVVAAVINDPSPDSPKPHTRLTVATGIPLNQTLSYQIRVAGNGQATATKATLTITVNSGSPVVAAIDPSWDGHPIFFAAGAYPQDHEGDSSEAGSVVFYQLAASHPDHALDVLNNANLPQASASIFYQTRLDAGGGVGSASWSLVSGHPPTGVTLAANGLLSGTPAQSAVSATPHKFTVRATDSTGETADKELRLVVGR